MSRTRTVVSTSLRVLLALAGATAAVALVGAAIIAPLPEHHTNVAAVDVQPNERGQQRVCPGPLLLLAEDAADATASRSVGSARTTDAVEPADAVLERIPLDTPGNSNADRDGTPEIVVTEPGAVDAGFVAASQSQTVTRETFRGLAVAPCVEAVAASWLVGGATDVGRTTLVLLSNPDEVAATVDVRVSGEAGLVEAPSGLDLVVPPRSQRVLSLAGLAPNIVSPVVSVVSEGGAIAATLQQSVVNGLDPAGVELIATAARPSALQVIPGLVVPETGGIDATEDHTEGDDYPALRLFAPGADPVAASVSLIPEGGGEATMLDASLTPGQVLDVPLGVLESGSYTLVVDADGPVIAAARSTTPGAGDAADAPGDFAWAVATAPLIDELEVAVPAGPSPRLHLANASDAAAEVSIDEGGSERTVTVPASGAVSVDVDADSALTLRGVRGLYASVTVNGPQSLAAMPVQPPGPLESPIAVYPR